MNIRVPFNLIRAGVRLTAFLPTGLHDQINKALKENGVFPFPMDSPYDVAPKTGRFLLSVPTNRPEPATVVLIGGRLGGRSV